MLHLIGLKNCDKTREARKWLKNNSVDFEFIDLKEEPLNETELEDLKIKVGMDVLVNKRSTTWRNLDLSGRELNSGELFEVLLNNQKLIKRPVLVDENAVLVGYDEEAFESFVEKE